ncbi:hypothetical protein OROMI_006815 [Orobanche minor]
MNVLWPAFVPVHDPTRKAYIGIQNMGTVFTRRFEADRIGSQVPIKLMHLEGLYELFISKFNIGRCHMLLYLIFVFQRRSDNIYQQKEAYTALDWSMHHFRVHFKMKLTYRTPIYDEEDELQELNTDIAESSENLESEANGKTQWDDDFPWSKWYSVEDPVRGFELFVIWSEITAESSLDMAELENASPLEADKWFLRPCLPENIGISAGSAIGFASQLRLLVKSLEMSPEAVFIEDFVSVEISGSENLKSSGVIPPPTVLDRVLKDLFHDVMEPQSISSLDEHKSSRSIKGAPLESLFAQFCLHALWFGNCSIREFLAVCIDNKRREFKDHNVGANDSVTTHVLQEDCSTPRDFRGLHGVSEGHASRSIGLAGSMMLLKSCKIMRAPITQDPPPMTEDMHEERLRAAEAFGDCSSFSGQLEKDILVSDMSAFKAANPDAVFEDFIRWHSPRDWENDDNEEDGISQTNTVKVAEVKWPPRGRLSERMSDNGNSWRKSWNEALPFPASEQKPLLDPNREGEKVLHYLETLRPCLLLEQMVCTAFRAAADTLNQTSCSELKQMTTKMGQLYLTMASTLKYLQSHKTTRDNDNIGDLRRLCITFEHIEKLILLAASLRSKFLHSLHLAQAIFSDCYEYYQLNMGTGSEQGGIKKEFDKTQRVRSRDRNLIVSIFTPPTANQSWRKVLSMGNILNGHEPILREIIFSKRDRVSESYYAACTPTLYQQEIETHRLYVCGTSNDLRVALAVTSFD